MEGSLAAVAGLLLGLAFGATVHRSHFCTMGAIADVALFGDWRRMRSCLLAVAVALLGSQALQLGGAVDLSRSLYAAASWPWPLMVAGGLLFGFGMTQTGGCASRTVVRLGAGNLKSLLVLVIMAAAAGVTFALMQAATGGPTPQTTGAGASGTLGQALAWAGGASRVWEDALLALPIAAGLLWFCFRDRAFRAPGREIAAGLILGALVALGWLAMLLSAGPASQASLNFVLPLAAGGAGLAGAGFGLALILGATAGAFVAARASGSFRIERFSGTDDVRRHVVGALLMGVGGGLALGCTIGHGVSGIAALAPASLLAVAGLVAGGVAGVRYLEHGSLRGAMRALVAGG